MIVRGEQPEPLQEVREEIKTPTATLTRHLRSSETLNSEEFAGEWQDFGQSLAHDSTTWIHKALEDLGK